MNKFVAVSVLVSMIGLIACNADPSSVNSTQFSEFEGHWISKTNEETGLANLMQIAASGEITTLYAEPSHRNEALPVRLIKKDGSTSIIWRAPETEGDQEAEMPMKAYIGSDGKLMIELTLEGQVLKGDGFTKISAPEAEKKVAELRDIESRIEEARNKLRGALIGKWTLVDSVSYNGNEVTSRKLPNELPDFTPERGTFNGAQKDFKSYTPKSLEFSSDAQCIVNDDKLSAPVSFYLRGGIGLVLEDAWVGTQSEPFPRSFQIRVESEARFCLYNVDYNNANLRHEFCYNRVN
jgi:hypothetical protein